MKPTDPPLATVSTRRSASIVSTAASGVRREIMMAMTVNSEQRKRAGYVTISNGQLIVRKGVCGSSG
jgi:outer membrane lipopolysaccharide assembly protein LptE/RlpB